MGGDYGSVGWLCDSAGGGSAVIKQRKGEKGREQAVFYKQRMHEAGCEMDRGGQLGLVKKQNKTK